MASVSQISGHIVKGAYTHISRYPHSAFLSIGSYTCGASIINQVILLTAAHCVYDYPNPKSIIAFVGHMKRQEGIQYRVLSLIVHENFNLKLIGNDIALLRLKKRLIFGRNVARVLLLPNPPYNKKATVAGWGVTNDFGGHISDYLKHLSQKVYKGVECGKIGLKRMSIGTICGEHKQKQGHPDQGDSGSALVVQKYIQIGIVSYNEPGVSRTNTIFTDTGYFYNWIQENSKKLYCRDKTK